MSEYVNKTDYNHIDVNKLMDNSPVKENLVKGYISDKDWRGYKHNDELVYDIIPQNTILYRGGKVLGFNPPLRINTGSDKSLKKSEREVTLGSAIYYSPDLAVAMRYLPISQIGYINTFATKRKLKLLRLDDISNINKMLIETFSTNKKVYIALRNFLGDFRMINAPVETSVQLIDSKHYMRYDKFTKTIELGDIPFVRQSNYGPDLILSNWLCDKGFDGYSAGPLYMYDNSINSTKCCFAPEVMLCNSLNDVDFVIGYKMKNSGLEISELRNHDSYRKILNNKNTK